MDLLGGYDTNSDDEGGTSDAQAKAQKADRRFLKAAPSISIMTKRKHGHELIVRQDPNNFNAVITEAIQGPQVDDPSTAQNQLARFNLEKNVPIDYDTFTKQRKQFQRTGQAVATLP